MQTNKQQTTGSRESKVQTNFQQQHQQQQHQQQQHQQQQQQQHQQEQQLILEKTLVVY